MALDFITTDEKTGKRTRYLYPDQGLVGQTVHETADVIGAFLHMTPEDARYGATLIETLMYGPGGQAARTDKGQPNIFGLLIHLRALCSLRGQPGEATYCRTWPVDETEFKQFQSEEAMREYKKC